MTANRASSVNNDVDSKAYGEFASGENEEVIEFESGAVIEFEPGPASFEAPDSDVSGPAPERPNTRSTKVLFQPVITAETNSRVQRELAILENTQPWTAEASDASHPTL
jgi:hypothetical protein